MQDYACKLSTDPTVCDCTDCFLDSNDMTCKRSRVNRDNPCTPSTYNAYGSATGDLSCTACTPGKSSITALISSLNLN